MPTTKETMVTPAMASEWLERHFERIAKNEFTQRRIEPKTVSKYAADMRIGKWLLCPQPISFDVQDNLIDGQHRLEAVRQSGATVQMMVSTGWPVSQNGVSTIDTIDRGRVRAVAAQLALHGVSNAVAITASVASVTRLLTGGKNLPVSYAQTIYILDQLDFQKHLDKIHQIMASQKITGRLFGPLAYYRTIRPGKADEFANRLETLDVEKGSAVQAFARYFRDRSKQHSQEQFIQVLCAALRLWDANEPAAFLRGSREATQWLLKQNPKLYSTLQAILKTPPLEIK